MGVITKKDTVDFTFFYDCYRRFTSHGRTMRLIYNSIYGLRPVDYQLWNDSSDNSITESSVHYSTFIVGSSGQDSVQLWIATSLYQCKGRNIDLDLDPTHPGSEKRLTLMKLMPNVSELIIRSRCWKGDVFIPKFPIISTDMSFGIKIIQFPIRLYFSISMNRIRGPSSEVNHTFKVAYSKWGR